MQNRRIVAASRGALGVPAGLLLGALLAAGPAGTAAAASKRDLARCDQGAAAALDRCFSDVGGVLGACYESQGSACPDDDADIEAMLARLSARVLAVCPDAAIVQDLGIGAQLTPEALSARLAEACLGEAQALASRSFGGPQGALADTGSAEDDACLDTAYLEGRRLASRAFARQSRCVRGERFGGGCARANAESWIEDRERRGLAQIAQSCADLKRLIGMDPETFMARARAQARCMTAAAHGASESLELDCGPREGVPVPPRGQWTQVVLDEAVWGTRCGNGSPYAFWLRLAPAGSPPENVLIHQQGGGVCIFESACPGPGSGLYEALSDYQPDGPAGGYFSTDPAQNPFADWTMLALPYCTQDVHIGGGVTTEFAGGLTVHRFGGINVRAALRYLRDVLWGELDATDGQGYRPDRLRVLFGGTSAGGFGVSYNYHYVLDDLRWAHTTAVPDSSLALDNGEVVGIQGLGLILTLGPPIGWDTRPFQAPYCSSGACAVVPTLNAATAPRLRRVPHQQVLNLSNQVDPVQVGTTFFASLPDWINALRGAYCATQGLNGISYFLPADPRNIHGILPSTDRFQNLASDGVTVREWLASAMSDPDGVVDRVEEGSLADDPAVDPFACNVD